MIGLVLALGVTLSAGQSATVEPESSGLFVKNVQTEAAKKEERLKLASLARCFVTRDRGLARRMVLEQWSSSRVATLQYHWGLGKLSCMPAEGTAYRLGYPTDLFTYAVADELVAKDKHVRLGDPARRARVKVLTPTLPQGASLASLSSQQRETLIAELTLPVFGECVVRSAPALVEALLRTDIASTAEEAALQALTPSFGGCVAKDVTYRLSAETVRGTLALAYYRLAHAPVLAS